MLDKSCQKKIMDNAQHDSSFLTFRVGPYHLAVPAVDAEAIITMPEIRSVPLTPGSVSGVFSHRGKIAVVISLKRKFGLKDSDGRSADQLIMSQLSTGLKAFRVDEVLDIIPASGINFSTLPALGRVTAFDRFAVKNDQIILHTDFELLFRLEESKELAASLKSLTKALKPEPDSDQPVPDGNMPVSEISSPSVLETNAEQASINHSDSHVSSTDGNPPTIDSEKGIKQKPETTEKEFVLRPGKRPARKPIPYKPRTIQRQTTAKHRQLPNRQFESEQPKRYRWIVGCGIVILCSILLSMIWLWPDSDKDLKVAYGNEEPAVNSDQDVSTPPIDLPPKRLTDNRSELLLDTIDVSEDKNDKTVKPEESTDRGEIALKTAEEVPEAVEKGSAGFTTPQKNKEILRIDTDDFTLTVERPQLQQTEAKQQIGQLPITKEEDPQKLKTDKQQPLKTERAQPEKAGEGGSIPVSAGMEFVHVVVKGDTLWDIAEKYLGDPFRYPELAKLSRISDPDLIYPGDLIRITKKKQILR